MTKSSAQFFVAPRMNQTVLCDMLRMRVLLLRKFGGHEMSAADMLPSPALDSEGRDSSHATFRFCVKWCCPSGNILARDDGGGANSCCVSAVAFGPNHIIPPPRRFFFFMCVVPGRGGFPIWWCGGLGKELSLFFFASLFLRSHTCLLPLSLFLLS